MGDWFPEHPEPAPDNCEVLTTPHARNKSLNERQEAALYPDNPELAPDNCEILNLQGPLLSIWFNFNSSMDK